MVRAAKVGRSRRNARGKSRRAKTVRRKQRKFVMRLFRQQKTTKVHMNIHGHLPATSIQNTLPMLRTCIMSRHQLHTSTKSHHQLQNMSGRKMVRYQLRDWLGRKIARYTVPLHQPGIIHRPHLLPGTGQHLAQRKI